MHFRALAGPIFGAAVLLAPLGCELVLGDLPKARPADAGEGGGGATSATTAGGAGGSTTTSGSGGAPATTTTTTTTTTSGGGAGGCCDCDGDTHAAKGVCGGDDCDDGDKKAYPGEPTYYGDPNPIVGFDWDCNGTPERDPMLDKFVDCGLLALPCAAGMGFLGKTPPACGAKADWGTCKQSGITCVKDVLEVGRVMTCK